LAYDEIDRTVAICCTPDLQQDCFSNCNCIGALADVSIEQMDQSHSQLTQLLTSAGFSAEQAAQALVATGGNVEAAMNW
jgi:hypothetical protein